MPRASPATASPENNKMTDFEQEIASLANLSHPDLVTHWQGIHGAPPPKGISRKLLLLATSYRMQVDAFGALDAKTNRYLRDVAKGTPNAVRPSPSLRPGMRLMREWNGRTHMVDVTENGLLWHGKSYSSLSAIAREITGARWSGPRFFGLRRQSS